MYVSIIFLTVLVHMATAQYSFLDKDFSGGWPPKTQRPAAERPRTVAPPSAPNLSETPVNTITIGERTFVQNYAASTYYIRKGPKKSGEVERPRTLNPLNYKGPAEFYAFYNPRHRQTHYTNYVKGTKGVVDGFHVFDDVLEPYQSVSMVQKMLEMMRDTPFFN